MSPISSVSSNVHESPKNVVAPLPIPPAEPLPYSHPAPVAASKEAAAKAAESLQQIESAFILQTLGPNPFFIEADKVQAIRKKLGWDDEKILRYLAGIAKQFARPSISNYQVGAAGLGESGAIYLGVNLEFEGCQLNQSIHAEQFLIAHARNRWEKNVTMIATLEPPCGTCRQFMTEIENGGAIKILYQKDFGETVSTTLSALLPDAFGPQNLGIKGGLLGATFPFEQYHEKPLVKKAMEASIASYSPYNKSRKAGLALKTSNNKIYVGSYLENAAFNPSLSPLQTALVALVTDLVPYEKIKEVVLVENKPMHARETEFIISQIAPKASFQALLLQPKAVAKS